jgi:alpha-ketoglutarate-dependent taurine dioxygenase
MREGYSAWRERKLAAYPERLEDLIVEVRDPRQLSAAEHGAILERIARANFAVYASAAAGDADKALVRSLGTQFGLERLDPNFLADEDGISSITVREDPVRGEYIPYTDRALGWHTDGYYNPPGREIRAFVLHCVRPAAEGGETSLLDHEIAWLLLQDANPAWARALMAAQAMTIPARDATRAAQTGPVFSFDAGGALHMRYTARTVSIRWAADADTTAAVDFLARLLGEHPPYSFRLKLRPGMGVICNNVLHARSAFRDDAAAPRLLYRARYYDRIRV